MKYIPEQYEWHQGDIIVKVDADHVAIRTNNGWKHTNMTLNDELWTDAAVTKGVLSGEWRYVNNRRIVKPDWWKKND